MFANRPGTPGFDVYDADTRCDRRMHIQVDRQVEDVRGLHHGMNCKQAPALVGACPFCTVPGVIAHKTTGYPTFVCLLPVRDALRAACKHQFKDHPDLSDWHEATPPQKMTTARALASGQRVQSGESKEKDEAYKGICRIYNICDFENASPHFAEIFSVLCAGPDVFTDNIPEYDKCRRVAADMAHAVLNFAKDLFGLVANNGHMALKASKLDREHNNGRFHDIPMGRSPKAPWHASKANMDRIEATTTNMKVPTDWPKTIKVFSEGSSMKIADALSLCGG